MALLIVEVADSLVIVSVVKLQYENIRKMNVMRRVFFFWSKRLIDRVQLSLIIGPSVWGLVVGNTQ